MFNHILERNFEYKSSLNMKREIFISYSNILLLCSEQVDSSGEKIRRSKTVPLPDLTENIEEESVKRTIYCKGFPKDGSIDLDNLLSFFKSFGEYDAVRVSEMLSI